MRMPNPRFLAGSAALSTYHLKGVRHGSSQARRKSLWSPDRVAVLPLLQRWRLLVVSLRMRHYEDRRHVSFVGRAYTELRLLAKGSSSPDLSGTSNAALRLDGSTVWSVDGLASNPLRARNPYVVGMSL